MKQNNPVVIMWFDNDLRVRDNPALWRAAQAGQVACVYVHDTGNAQLHGAGAAQSGWIGDHLAALNEKLQGKLALFAGDPGEILLALVKLFKARTIYCNRRFTPWAQQRDKKIKQALAAEDIALCQCDDAALLWHPGAVRKDDGKPYGVFSAFYRHARRKGGQIRPLYPDPPALALVDPPAMAVSSLQALGLREKSRWYKKVQSHWGVGEEAAANQLEKFLQTGLAEYAKGRDFPAKANVSRLSVYLAIGVLSPHQLWWAASERVAPGERNLESFLREIGWREFSAYLLYYFPDMPERNWRRKFDQFPWREDAAALSSWKRGETGIPLVDAGMRELWQTGYMHNRVRMVVGSFLIKNLGIDWREGAAWFWDTLLDADAASNSASWQWVAGSGADAAPYFRIFNPLLQAQKFDPQAQYIRKYVPELAHLDTACILAGTDLCQKAAYVAPLVDLRETRARALQAFSQLS